MSKFNLITIDEVDVVETVEPGDFELIMRTAHLSGGITIHYPQMLDGGGLEFKDDLFNIIKDYGKSHYSRGFEWCCGPGFLMYEALGRGLVDNFAASDYYYPAIENVIENANRNQLNDKITTYHTPLLSNIPKNEKWNLVIGNPPWVADYSHLVYGYKRDYPHYTDDNIVHIARVWVDNQWKIHKEFFKNLKKYVTKDADIFLMSGFDPPAEFLGVKEIVEFAKENGFKLMDVHKSNFKFKNPFIKLVIYHYKPE